jgi:catechol 2,3-dioxygenase-like lactoylglutathione lyase family enzyme
LARGIDHLVIAVRHLDLARAAYHRLGFRLTPEAHHPFGTKNSLVQLDQSFLELVAINDPATIPEPGPAFFSFAAFNRDFLKTHEGLSMLALKSGDANIDMADFATHGLRTYAPVHFERIAHAPDGTAKKVAFTMTFTGDEQIRENGFFTCQHHYPGNFWRPEYQSHANGARKVRSVVAVAGDPEGMRDFLTRFTGVTDVKSSGDCLVLDTGDGMIEVMTPVRFGAMFGGALAADVVPRLVASVIEVADLEVARTFLTRNGVAFEERAGRLVVPEAESSGIQIAFVGSNS